MSEKPINTKKSKTTAKKAKRTKPAKTEVNKQKTSPKKPVERTKMLISLLLSFLMAGNLALSAYLLYQGIEVKKDLESQIEETQTKARFEDEKLSVSINSVNQRITDLTKPQTPEVPTELAIPAPQFESDHWRGNPDSRYVIVEYSDYQCPYCGRVHESLSELESQNSDLAWVYRHYPLDSHPNAKEIAEISECVNRIQGQEGFWKFTDYVMANQSSIVPINIPSIAAQTGLDSQELQKCYDQGLESASTNTKIQQAKILAVNNMGTPTSIFYDTKTENTRVVIGALPVAQFQQVFNDFKQETK